MITIEFTKEEKQALHYERFNHPHPRVQLKMEALWLKSQELLHNEICRITCISKPTLCTYLKDYKEGGIETFKQAISNYLSHTHDLYKEELDSLLTFKFQTFKEVKKVKITTS